MPGVPRRLAAGEDSCTEPRLLLPPAAGEDSCTEPRLLLPPPEPRRSRDEWGDGPRDFGAAKRPLLLGVPDATNPCAFRCGAPLCGDAPGNELDRARLLAPRVENEFFALEAPGV